MSCKVLLVLKDVSLFKSLAQEALARRIPCRISVFQSIPALIESNSFDHADAVLLDASLLKTDALTEDLLCSGMGQKAMVFGRAINERTAHVLAEAGIQYQAADSKTTLCDALEAMLIEYRSDSHWNAVQLFPKSLPLSTLLRLALRIPVLEASAAPSQTAIARAIARYITERRQNNIAATQKSQKTVLT